MFKKNNFYFEYFVIELLILYTLYFILYKLLILSFINFRTFLMNIIMNIYIYIFLFRPKNYYKLSLRVTFNNIFGNLWKSWRVYAQ